MQTHSFLNQPLALVASGAARQSPPSPQDIAAAVKAVYGISLPPRAVYSDQDHGAAWARVYHARISDQSLDVRVAAARGTNHFLTWDFNIVPSRLFKSWPDLIAFDMDGTLIEEEGIDLIAERLNVGKTVAAITEQAMRGDIDFEQSFERRIALLAGLSREAFEDVARCLTPRSGAEFLIQRAKTHGVKLAAISGGIDILVNDVAQKLQLDAVRSNRLAFKEGVCTGRVLPPVMDGNQKLHDLRALSDLFKITLQDVVVVGDGANDVAMARVARFGVGIQPKPVMAQMTAINLWSTPMSVLSALFSHPERLGA